MRHWVVETVDFLGVFSIRHVPALRKPHATAVARFRSPTCRSGGCSHREHTNRLWQSRTVVRDRIVGEFGGIGVKRQRQPHRQLSLADQVRTSRIARRRRSCPRWVGGQECWGSTLHDRTLARRTFPRFDRILRQASRRRPSRYRPKQADWTAVDHGKVGARLGHKNTRENGF